MSKRRYGRCIAWKQKGDDCSRCPQGFAVVALWNRAGSMLISAKSLNGRVSTSSWDFDTITAFAVLSLVHTTTETSIGACELCVSCTASATTCFCHISSAYAYTMNHLQPVLISFISCPPKMYLQIPVRCSCSFLLDLPLGLWMTHLSNDTCSSRAYFANAKCQWLKCCSLDYERWGYLLVRRYVSIASLSGFFVWHRRDFCCLSRTAL